MWVWGGDSFKGIKRSWAKATPRFLKRNFTFWTYSLGNCWQTIIKISGTGPDCLAIEFLAIFDLNIIHNPWKYPWNTGKYHVLMYPVSCSTPSAWPEVALAEMHEVDEAKKLLQVQTWSAETHAANAPHARARLPGKAVRRSWELPTFGPWPLPSVFCHCFGWASHLWHHHLHSLDAKCSESES